MNYPGFVLKKGITGYGDECLYIKKCLYTIGYLTPEPKKKNFGSDTDKAVRKFQKENIDNRGRKLEVDGKIGPITWDAIIREYEKKIGVNGNLNPNEPQQKPVSVLKALDYPNITASNLAAISESLKGINSKRVEFVKFILRYAKDIDYTANNNPTALYIFGANLVDSNLNIQLASESGFIDAKAKRNPKYFDDGRLNWMKSWALRNPNLAASDCSGMIVGFLRMFKYVSNSFDTTANSLCSSGHSSSTTKAKLVPGDFVGFSGHIGVFVGAGFVVEFAGGAYGCQLTRLNNRKLRDLMTGMLISGKSWTKFRTPKWFK